MLEISCSGDPYEIGHQHGRAATAAVNRSINFYAVLFQKHARLDWDAVTKRALEFVPFVKQELPAYYEEMTGLADGSSRSIGDILALNVRTEINYGLWSDGCTALSWKTDGASFLAQNWDWEAEQAANLVLLTIQQPGKPTVKTVTEAGIIGKIGLNSAGVGVCLNAIRARGMVATRIPCHLGLRLVLDSSSKEEALNTLERFGVASACHFLVADGGTGGVGVEWSAVDSARIRPDSRGRVFHSNHYVVPHAVPDDMMSADSPVRLRRIAQLADEIADGGLSVEKVFDLFKDEQGLPAAICRKQDLPKSTVATLFNIVMELASKKATVTLGRPSDGGERLDISFDHA